jgi:hypothetical protein
MLTYSELPGFPTTDERLQCLSCRRLQFTEPNRWARYTENDLVAWENSLQPGSVHQNAVIQDPSGNIGIHTADCVYAGVPPIALWQMDPVTANRVRARLLAARIPPVPPVSPPHTGPVL